MAASRRAAGRCMVGERRAAADAQAVGRHDSVSAIHDLVAAWRAEGVRLEPPASEADLQSLEAALGAAVPLDARAFYLHANGMADLEYDHHSMSFWSIGKIISEGERSEGQDPNGPFSELAIADFLLNSWFVSLRVRCGAVYLFVEGSGEEFSDFSSFAARYLRSPDSLPIL
jgi:SMI1 / KNR4 family (SUKH-1)